MPSLLSWSAKLSSSSCLQLRCLLDKLYLPLLAFVLCKEIKHSETERDGETHRALTHCRAKALWCGEFNQNESSCMFELNIVTLNFYWCHSGSIILAFICTHSFPGKCITDRSLIVIDLFWLNVYTENKGDKGLLIAETASHLYAQQIEIPCKMCKFSTMLISKQKFWF